VNQAVALVSGANKGLGYATAQELARQGMKVYLGARSAEAGVEAERALRAQGLDARWLALDVTADDSVSAAVRRVAAEAGRIDVLVNNAGIYLRTAGSPLEQPVEEILRTLQTNFLGAVRMTQACLPLLRQSQGARVVNVSSGLGSLAQQADVHFPYARFKSLSYAPSKAALNAATVTFAALLSDTPIKVNAADPGRCATDLNGHAGERSAADGARIIVKLATLAADGPSGGFFDDNGRVPW
jgi:NAD(P)-dependent dehydrogenase (short-subunit alcohol dehydrogenase family)